MMELRLLPPLVAFEVNLVLGAFALTRVRRGLEPIWFAGFALSAALWSLGAALYYLFPAELQPVALRIGFAGGAAVPAVYLAFCRGRAAEPRPGRTATPELISALALVLVLAVANLDLVLPGRLRDSEILISIQIIAVCLYFAGLYLAAFLALRPGLRSPHPDRRREAKFVFYAAALPFAAILLYTFVVWAVPPLPRPNLLLPVMVGAELMLYFAVRFRKIEADELLARGLLYLVYTIVLTGLLFLVLFGLGRLFQVQVSLWQFTALVGVCLISAFGFAAGRSRIQAWVDREFFPEKYEYERKIISYEEELGDARARLHRAERLAALGELSARVAHEIKNPLGPIKGYARLLQDAAGRGQVSPELLAKAARIIGEEADKIDERVRGFLDLARRPPLQRAETDLRELIERTIPLLEAKPGLLIRRDFQADSHIADVDPDQLQGALYNILQNAAQALAGQGEIVIATAADHGLILISIRDNGPGIKPDALAEIFEPFRTGAPGGYGLGLAIARSVVEAHGGRIEAGNREGGGAEFKVWVPGASESKSLEPPMDADERG